jgi:cellulose synthase/poly-beta-1,6-N-acetylglucosamine synthase-like glycosyltransferase
MFPNPVVRKDITPSVSIVIAAYNEEKNIEQKIKNCLFLDYPADKMEVIIGSDGSTDRTAQLVERYSNNGVRFYLFAERQGKASVLNYIVPLARGQIIVFTDARQRFASNAIRELVKNFADDRVGCVSGELILTGEEQSEGGGAIGLYWKYEKFIRKCESGMHSMIGATGAIYAIRKKLYISAGEDILLDDVSIPLNIVRQDYRAIFEPRAKAYDSVSRTLRDESRRKIRTLAGNWQLFVRLSPLLNPFKYKIAIPLISHKVLRVLVPYFLLVLAISNVFLLERPFYKIAGILQILFYLSAFAGYKSVNAKIKLLNTPYVFCQMNIDAVKGLFAYIYKTQKVTWDK